MNTFPVKIIDNSGLNSDTPIFLYVTGINSTVPNNTTQQFFDLQNGTWQDTQVSSKLSDLPKDNDGNPVLNTPFIDSGIIFISINTELQFNGTSPPDFSNPSNPNYTTLFDKFEITFLQSQGFPFIDTTNVDFFCLPFSLQETLSDETMTDIVGFTMTKEDLFNQFTTQLTGTQWPTLIQKDGSNNIIRVVAPNKALVPPNDFDATFFQVYIDKVWDYYGRSGNTLTVDMTEIEQWNPGYNVLFTGRVPTDPNDPNNGLFTFSGTSSSGTALPDITFQKPTGDQIKTSVFGCADLFDAPNKTPRSVPAKNLGAAFNVGVLALQPGNLNLTSPNSQLAPNGWANLKPDFYKQTMGALDGGFIDCFNLYSHILHENAEGGRVYGFAYDDVTGSDSTLANNQAVNAILTIQNLSTT